MDPNGKYRSGGAPVLQSLSSVEVLALAERTGILRVLHADDVECRTKSPEHESHRDVVRQSAWLCPQCSPHGDPYVLYCWGGLARKQGVYTVQLVIVKAT